MISMAGFEDPEKRKEQERLAAAAQAQAQAPAPAEPGLLQMPEKPMTPFEQLRDNHGTGGAILRLLGTGLSGGLLGDVLTPEIGRASQAEYATDLATYKAYQNKMMEQQIANQASQADRKRLSGVYDEWDAVVNDGDPTNDARGYTRAINNGADPDALALAYASNPMFAAGAGRDLPDATRAVIHYQDSLNRYVDSETGEQKMRKPGEDGYVKYADAFDRYKNREVGGLREQAAARAGGQSQGQFDQETINKAPAEAATMNSAMSTIESLGNIGTDPETGEVTFTPNNLGEFEDVYGTLDQFKPFGFSTEESFIRSTVEKLGSILAVDARGKLKGQGQISDKETAMLEKSLSILSSRGISPQKAREEIARIYSIMQKGFMEKQEIINPTQGNQSGGGSDFDTLWNEG